MLIQTEPNLASTCTSLAGHGSSGAREIDDLLSSRPDETKAAEFEKLRSLSSSLRQLANHASQLQKKLSNSPDILPKLKSLLSSQLPSCDDAAAIVAKQIMRLGRETPREAMNLVVILQYDSFAEITNNLLRSAMGLISSGSLESQDAKLRNQDMETLLARAAAACRHVMSSDGLLLDATANGHPASTQHLLDQQDTLPPAYEAPPPFKESSLSASGYTKSTLTKPNKTDTNGSSSGGGFLSSAFKAAASALRTKPEPLVVPLCHAASQGNISQLRSLVDQGVNLNGRNDEGRTALICAILGGQVDAVRVLLEAGADPTVTNSGRKGKPPLFHAVDAGLKEAADLLLKHGAPANQLDDWNQPYFINLVIGDASVNWIELLLSHGADANAKDVQGRPLAILALQNRKKHDDREQVVEVLLKYNAKPDSKDLDGTPLIYFCVQQGRDSLTQKLLSSGANANGRDVSGIPLLLTAVKRRDCALAKALLEKGADPNVKDLYGLPILMNILSDGKINATDRDILVKMLLQHGAEGNAKDMWNVTALEHTLAPLLKGISPLPGKEDKFEILDLLLQRGADANQVLNQAPGEPTLLTYAVERSLYDLASLALRHGANANLADKKGRLPLLLAVRSGNEEMVALLIQYGANVNQSHEESPLDAAIALGENEIAQLLQAHGAGSSNSFAGKKG